MDKIVITAADRFTKPNAAFLIGQWEPKRYRGRVSYDCICHEGDMTYILSSSLKFHALSNLEYFTAIEPKNESRGARFVNPYTPLTLIVDKAHPELRVDITSDVAKYIEKDRVFNRDPQAADCLFVYYNEADVNKKASQDFEFKLRVQNFINNLANKKNENGKEVGVDEMRDIVYYFGSGITPKTDKIDLLLQIAGEPNGILWQTGDNGRDNAKEFERVFMDESSLDKELVIVCNKAVDLHIIEIRDKTTQNSKVLAYYWKDSFIDTSKEGVYSYFNSDERMFASLKNEVNRKLGKAVVQNKELVSEKAQTNPNRGELVKRLIDAFKDGVIKLKDGDPKPGSMGNDLLKSYIEELDSVTSSK